MGKENTAGITLQEIEGVNAADLVADIRQPLEKSDDRTVCYDAGEEGDILCTGEGAPARGGEICGGDVIRGRGAMPQTLNQYGNPISEWKMFGM